MRVMYGLKQSYGKVKPRGVCPLAALSRGDQDQIKLSVLQEQAGIDRIHQTPSLWGMYTRLAAGLYVCRLSGRGRPCGYELASAVAAVDYFVAAMHSSPSWRAFSSRLQA
jgi:hypothetical protein